MTPAEPDGLAALLAEHPPAVAAIFPRAADVAVYLEHGAALPDPHGLLTGTGRRTRTLVFAPGAAAPSDAHLVEYLDLAVEPPRAGRICRARRGPTPVGSARGTHR